MWEFLHIDPESRKDVTDNYDEWISKNSNFYSWTRLNVLLTLVSNFEIYISNITAVAIESNPGLLFGKTDRIDGVNYLKNKSFDKHLLKEHRKKIVLETTRGDWIQRVKGLKKYFGSIPPIFDDKIESLEKMRAMRNNIAHSFGRNIEKAQENRSIDTLNPISIKEEVLLEYSKDIYTLARALDSFLMEQHIGSFEDLYYYHNNIAVKNSLLSYNGNIMTYLKKTSYSDVGLRSKNYWEQLIRYYYESDKELILPVVDGFEICEITENNISEIYIPARIHKKKIFDPKKWVENNDRIFRDFGINIKAVKKKDKYLGLIGFDGIVKSGKSKMNFVFYQNSRREKIEEACVNNFLKKVTETYPYFKYYFNRKVVKCYKKEIVSELFLQ